MASAASNLGQVKPSSKTVSMKRIRFIPSHRLVCSLTFFTDAARSASGSFPGADAHSFVKVEAWWADVVFGLAIDTVDELMALGGILLLHKNYINENIFSSWHWCE